MKNLLKLIYSKEKTDELITKRILGIKFKKNNWKQIIINENLKKLSILFNIMHDQQIQERLKINDKPENIVRTLASKITKTPRYLLADKHACFLDILLNCKPIEYQNVFDIDDAYILWGIRPIENHIKTFSFAKNLNRPVLFMEDSFLRSADTAANKKAPEKFRKGISFTIDDLTTYFDATRPSRMEQMLNDKTLIITDEQRQRARNCIDKIVYNHLTKYNHQPIVTPKIGRSGVKKVLVVDQSFGDMSIKRGLADESTFEKMLECAKKENPDADIIVKTHPDTMAGKRGGYYTHLKEQNNIYLLKTPINPISLIKYVDEVYVCTTQFGFEALMCGKEVHTFGMPFYAGWGLTIDDQKCERRNNTRTLEEIFYIAYIIYSHYVNPETNEICEIEEAMDYLLKIRAEYFDINGVKHE